MELKMDVTEIFDKNFDALTGDEYSLIINQAGSRSGKTYAILQCIIVLCHTKPGLVSTIVRESLPQLKKTVIKDTVEILKKLKIYNKNNHNKTEQIYNFDNGSCIEFLSADSPEKLKGTKRDILFINECTEISHEAYLQLAMRTTGKKVVDFNPEDMEHWVYDNMHYPDTLTIRSTYKDNPFLQPDQIKFIEDKILVDENYYKIYVLGERPISNSRIYSHFKQFSDIKLIEDCNNIAYGLDFGYNHPTAMVKCYFGNNTNGEIVYVKEEIYKSGLTITDLIKEMLNLGIDKSKMIYCDSARPEIIEELKRNGYKAILSNKNVKQGIDKIKSIQISVWSESLNIWAEFKKYSWKTQNEKITDEPVKLDDDLVDSLRYCVLTHQKNAFTPKALKVFRF